MNQATETGIQEAYSAPSDHDDLSFRKPGEDGQILPSFYGTDRADVTALVRRDLTIPSTPSETFKNVKSGSKSELARSV